jgi:hypothetical protein
MFLRSGTYLGEVGLKTRGGSRIYLLPGPARAGFAEVSVNGHQLFPGDDLVELDGSSEEFVVFNSSHLVSIRVGKWSVEMESSDGFLNQRVKIIMASNNSAASNGTIHADDIEEMFGGGKSASSNITSDTESVVRYMSPFSRFHLSAHGLFGQTWRDATYKTAAKYIEGHVDDYRIAERNVFGDGFIYNKFRGENKEI